MVAVPVAVMLGSVRLNLPVIVGASIMVLFAVSLIFIMPENHFQPAPKEERSSWKSMGRQLVEGGKAIGRSGMLICILGVELLSGLSSEGYDRLSTAHLVKDFAFPTFWSINQVTWLGILSVSSTLLILAVTYLIERYVETKRSAILIGTMLLSRGVQIAAIIVFALVGNFWLGITMFLLYDVGRNATSPLFSTWVTQNSDPKMRATIFSVIGQTNALGQIVGGPGVGYIGDRFSIRAALVTSSLIMSPVTIFFLRAIGLSKLQPAPEVEGALVTEPVEPEIV